MRREDSLAYAPELLDPFEYIFHIMFDLEFLEKVYIFIFEGLFRVMLFLIQNIVVDTINLRMAVRECPIAFLPTKLSFDSGMVVDEIAGIILDIPHKVR